MATKRKVSVNPKVRINAYNVISDTVEMALHPNCLERFFKHHAEQPTREQLELISDKAAEAVMSALCEILLFDEN